MAQIPGQEGKAIRLLSCSDLESARALSHALPGREVYAREDLVRVHLDGGITTNARSGNATQKWKKLKDGQEVGDAPTPKAPEGEAVGKYVEMGLFDETSALLKWTTSSNRLKKLAQIYNLKGSQGILGYYPHKIQEWYRKLLNPDFDFAKTENRIGYYYHQGVYTINGGHHRVVAALIILDQTGDAIVLQKLLQNGLPTNSAPSPGVQKTLYTVDNKTLEDIVSDKDIPKSKGWTD